MKTIIYILMFAFATVIVYMWGIAKSERKESDLFNILCSKAQKRVLKLLKENEVMTAKEIELNIKNLKASLFYSKHKAVVKDPRTFTKTVLDMMVQKELIEIVHQKKRIVYKAK